MSWEEIDDEYSNQRFELTDSISLEVNTHVATEIEWSHPYSVVLECDDKRITIVNTDELEVAAKSAEYFRIQYRNPEEIEGVFLDETMEFIRYVNWLPLVRNYRDDTMTEWVHLGGYPALLTVQQGTEANVSLEKAATDLKGVSAIQTPSGHDFNWMLVLYDISDVEKASTLSPHEDGIVMFEHENISEVLIQAREFMVKRQNITDLPRPE